MKIWKVSVVHRIRTTALPFALFTQSFVWLHDQVKAHLWSHLNFAGFHSYYFLMNTCMVHLNLDLNCRNTKWQCTLPLVLNIKIRFIRKLKDEMHTLWVLLSVYFSNLSVHFGMLWHCLPFSVLMYVCVNFEQ